MYSLSQYHFDTENTDNLFSPTPGIPADTAGGSAHITIGAVPVARNTSYSFSAASIAMSSTPASGGRGIPLNGSSSQVFGTSMESAGSFGHSPIVGRDQSDLMISPSTSTSQLEGLTAGEEDESQQLNLQEMFEKRRRRRESHNAVERRRRENINDRIHELCTLLPEYLLESAPASSNVMSVSTNQTGGNSRPINKGTVLRLSIDHIKELQTEADQYREKVKELEQKICYLKGARYIPEAHTPSNHRIGGSARERMSSQQFGNLNVSPEELGRHP